MVDARGRLVGRLARASVGVGFAGSAVAEHVVAECCSTDESDSLGVPFTAMTTRHARALRVVGEDRVVVGALRDVDAMPFVSYVSRTGFRPLLFG